ncbi:hypothetical protein BCR33DRAFT_719232 [Rhizoclosmatium globosum]|uniref:Uncharacterized protein n=1 Tax=Rhizoclosmatium globosum TaxID=329046 RepID=A0A1Y2C0W0_9FUNG|nr:hypothetical protein BCR33DRAFT_719230 [Rhizoclosmatium globosum]ORY40686.1 hypothetical protein BCR33DRAFT_719232 [Rhizoclosmatium globosum]|eukprot:ORY40683.1 hypothetical protein BCR33DRAFT_719230 [Rhizoclosmatium globosum]
MQPNAGAESRSWSFFSKGYVMDPISQSGAYSPTDSRAQGEGSRANTPPDSHSMALRCVFVAWGRIGNMPAIFQVWLPTN